MKYCFYTNRVFGIIGLVFQGLIIIAAVTNENLFKGNIAAIIGQLIILCFFGIMGVMLLISSNKIKKKMQLDRETESFLTGIG